MCDSREKLRKALEQANQTYGEYLSEVLSVPITEATKLFPMVMTLPEFFADHLIANGFTMAPQWISAEERLPTPFVSVLAYIPSESPLPTVHESYIADHDTWVNILFGEKYSNGEVTHWMPLPGPPEAIERKDYTE